MVVAPEEPDAFMRVRLKTARELERAKTMPGSALQLPGETSLDFFLRSQCQQTNFDADTIIVDEFLSKYALFCDEKRLVDPVTVSKALMAQKKIHTTKIETFLLESRTDMKDGSVKFFDLDRATKVVQDWDAPYGMQV